MTADSLAAHSVRHKIIILLQKRKFYDRIIYHILIISFTKGICNKFQEVKMKLGKVLSLILAAVMILAAVPMTVGAETDGYYTYTVTDGKSEITEVDTAITGDVTVPSELGGYPVTSIGDYAFSYCSAITTITIPESIAKIGEDAFYGLKSLSAITVDSGNTVYHSEGNCLIETAANTLLLGCMNSVIPDSVTSIGRSAFAECTSLTSITIPAGVTSIDVNSFYNCGALSAITVDSGNTVYHSEGNCLIETASNTLLLGCMNSVIPDGIKSIGYGAFLGCVGLTDITIPASVVFIYDSAFQGCSALTRITIPASVGAIGENAFFGCTGLSAITVDSDNEVFSGDGNCLIKTGTGTLILGCKNSVIPDGVTVIGKNAFIGCVGLTDVTIPESVTTIENCAFEGCTDLTGVTIPAGVTDFGYRVFEGCKNVTVTCYKDSAAHSYAEKNKISFNAIAPGDANLDGKVNLKDATLILQHIDGWTVTADTYSADVNDDGKVNIQDVTLILQYIAKWDVELK